MPHRVLLWLCCILVLGGTLPTNAQPLAPLVAPPPPPLDYLAEGASACFVYPIVFEQGHLGNVTPMPDPSVPAAQVPISSTFRVYGNATAEYARFLWSAWLPNYTAADLARSLTSGGTLGEGYQERTPPSGYTSAPLSNTLEINDWIYGGSGNVSSIDVTSALDWHIVNAQTMILPTFDIINGSGLNTNVRVTGFVKARLLDYNLNGSGKFLTFGLVANDASYACYSSHTDQSTVQFSNTMPLTNVTHLHWDFGDGTSTTGISPTHRYATTGTFTVTLSITDTLDRPSYAYSRININALTPISDTLFLPLIQQ